MDRRDTRRETMAELAALDGVRERLELLATEADGEGEVVLASELRRYLEKMTTLIDQMYVWAGQI